MRSLWEGSLAGLAALGAGLFAKERGWSPLQAAAAAGGTAFAAVLALRALTTTQEEKGTKQ